MKPSPRALLQPLFPRPRLPTPRYRLINNRWTPIVVPPPSSVFPEVQNNLISTGLGIEGTGAVGGQEGTKGKGRIGERRVRGLRIPQKPLPPADNGRFPSPPQSFYSLSSRSRMLYERLCALRIRYVPSSRTFKKDAFLLMSLGWVDVHLEELEHYHSLVASRRAALLSLISTEGAIPLEQEEWPIEFGSLSTYLSTIAGNDSAEAELERKIASRKVAEKEAKELRKSLPIAQRAFLEFEETLRNRRRSRAEATMRAKQLKVGGDTVRI